jgi:hypothetical protein
MVISEASIRQSVQYWHSVYVLHLNVPSKEPSAVSSVGVTLFHP